MAKNEKGSKASSSTAAIGGNGRRGKLRWHHGHYGTEEVLETISTAQQARQGTEIAKEVSSVDGILGEERELEWRAKQMSSASSPATCRPAPKFGQHVDLPVLSVRKNSKHTPFLQSKTRQVMKYSLCWFHLSTLTLSGFILID